MIKKIHIFLLLLTFTFILVSCGSTTYTVTFIYNEDTTEEVNVVKNKTVDRPEKIIEQEFQVFIDWFLGESVYDFNLPVTKDLVIEAKYYDFRLEYPNQDIYYQIFVRSFADSDNDGIGDLNGITQNLDYLKSLGITALWLLPIHPSPSYHGYNVTDYYGIQPDYGTMEDFDNLVEKAGELGIKIVLDLVVNHTSDQHLWYKEAIKGSNNPYRNYYLFNNNGNAYESFVGGMKDLNLANPEVVNEIYNIMDFYIEKGVDGFRLDAALHFFDRHGYKAKSFENGVFIHSLNSHMKEKYGRGYIVSEVFDYNYLAYPDYYIGSDSLFDFYTAQQIWQKIGSGSSSYLFVSNLARMYNDIKKVAPDFIPATFLTNHDLDRLASMPEFKGINAMERIKQATNVLLTLPGNPFIYYGEELGMQGTRKEGVNVPGYGTAYDEFRRTPFLWGNDYQTSWFPDSENTLTANQQQQSKDSNSLYSHYKSLIEIRKQTPALMFGNSFIPYNGNSGKLQGYIRTIETEYFRQAVLVIHNVSLDTMSLTLDHKQILYGNLELKPYETVIVEIDYNSIGDFS